MTDFNERRTNLHVQMLVEARVRLHRLRGEDYARSFLKDVHVPECIIELVLEPVPAASSTRRIGQVTYEAKADLKPDISSDY